MVGDGGVILVALVDGGYVVKIIEKGLAKALDPFRSEAREVCIDDDNSLGLEFNGRQK
jgi:hypothetical protein